MLTGAVSDFGVTFYTNKLLSLQNTVFLPQSYTPMTLSCDAISRRDVRRVEPQLNSPFVQEVPEELAVSLSASISVGGIHL